MIKYFSALLLVVAFSEPVNAFSCPANQNYVGDKDVNGEMLYCCAQMVDSEDMCDSGVYYITYKANGDNYLSGCGDDSMKPDQCAWTQDAQKRMQKAK